MYLNNRGRVTAKELADKYEVSIKTIQRDIESIDRSGVPIISYKGQDGGYEIIDKYKISSSAMKKEDVYLITKLLEGLNSTYNSKDIITLKEKFKAIESKEDFSDKFIMDFSSWGTGDKTKKKLEIIDKGFSAKKTIFFEYINLNGEISNRVIEPLRLVFKSFNWYLYGFCLKKNDNRIFKVRRMNNLELGEKFYSDRSINLAPLFNDREDNVIDIKLKITDSFTKKLDDYFDEYELTSKDGTNILNISLPLDEWVYGMILGFGNQAEVMAPLSLRKHIKGKIEEMNKIYK